MLIRFELNIEYPVEKMELSRKRLEARGKFRDVDRVPVQYCVVSRRQVPHENILWEL